MYSKIEDRSFLRPFSSFSVIFILANPAMWRISLSEIIYKKYHKSAALSLLTLCRNGCIISTSLTTSALSHRTSSRLRMIVGPDTERTRPAIKSWTSTSCGRGFFNFMNGSYDTFIKLSKSVNDNRSKALSSSNHLTN